MDAWLAQAPSIPIPPVTGSVTFSFDNAVSSVNNIVLPVGDFISNFGSPFAGYFYDETLDSLRIFFAGSGFIEIEAQFIDVSTHLFEPSVPPMLQFVLFRPSLDGAIGADDFSGGFAPAVPEPSTWAMLLLGFAGFGLLARRKREPSNQITAEAVPAAHKSAAYPST